MDQQWEYKIMALKMVKSGLITLTLDPASLEETFNNFGAEGWELFQLIPDAPDIHAIFKRRRRAS